PALLALQLAFQDVLDLVGHLDDRLRGERHAVVVGVHRAEGARPHRPQPGQLLLAAVRLDRRRDHGPGVLLTLGPGRLAEQQAREYHNPCAPSHADLLPVPEPAWRTPPHLPVRQSRYRGRAKTLSSSWLKYSTWSVSRSMSFLPSLNQTPFIGDFTPSRYSRRPGCSR